MSLSLAKGLGNGIMRYINGDVYEGDWKENCRQNGKYESTLILRKGILRSADGKIKQGNFDDEEAEAEEKITLRYADGNVYKGNMKEGLRHGKLTNF